MTVGEQVLVAVAADDGVVRDHVGGHLDDVAADDRHGGVDAGDERGVGVELHGGDLQLERGLRVHSPEEFAGAGVLVLGLAEELAHLFEEVEAGEVVRADLADVGSVQVGEGRGVGVPPGRRNGGRPGGHGGKPGQDADRHVGAGAVDDGAVEALSLAGGDAGDDGLDEVGVVVLEQRVRDGEIVADLAAEHGQAVEVEVDGGEGAEGVGPHALGSAGHDDGAALTLDGLDVDVGHQLALLGDVVDDEVEHHVRDAERGAADGAGVAEALQELLDLAAGADVGDALAAGDLFSGHFFVLSFILGFGFGFLGGLGGGLSGLGGSLVYAVELLLRSGQLGLDPGRAGFDILLRGIDFAVLLLDLGGLGVEGVALFLRGLLGDLGEGLLGLALAGGERVFTLGQGRALLLDPALFHHKLGDLSREH